ncbi:unnamed protein product [Calypogeia fissa]
MKCADGNILGLLDGRTIDSHQVPYPYQEHHAMRSLQMHSSLVQRLALEKVMEGHQGCVNTLAWNQKGSLLLSGSDDFQVNIWEYGTHKLLHSIYTGHSNNIFCTKFMPETGDDVVVSGAGDAEVRVHRVSRSAAARGRISSSEQTALFRCHAKRVKKLAVEDGNPHIVWSASEDGTLRQHDLRESVRCPTHDTSVQECRNVLLDLRSGSKKSLQDAPRNCLELKTCAISPTRPHHLLVGGSDAFARLYDRRMLPPLSSALQPSKPPPCVCYFCPAHLSEHGRPGIHLTHVMFSPNGEEVLLSYSGEHVYLMDSYGGQDDAVVYRASDVPKRTVLAPLINGTKPSQPQLSVGALGHGYRRNTSWVQECGELFEDAKKAVTLEKNYLHAIETCSEIIDAGGPAVGLGLRHDCLCFRAAAFLKRNWKNDVHMAIRDCNEARAINPMSTAAHQHMAESLSLLQRYKEALDFAMRAHHLEPTDSTLSDLVTQLRVKLKSAEDAKNNRGNERDVKLERKSRIRTISNLLLRSESDISEPYHDPWRSEAYDQDMFDDDIEMELEIEMSVAEEDERDREEGSPGSSLSLRLRPRLEGRDRLSRSLSSISSTSSTGMGSERSAGQADIAVDMRQRYVGHCNTGTDIKQASFLGERGEFVASGSDDGRWFIWAKKTGRLVKMLSGDEHVVNCVQCHPFDCAIATSGIDYTIKMWTPCAGDPSMVAGGVQGPEAGDLFRVMVENQHHMRRQGLPLEFLQRFRVQETNEGAAHPFECTQS